MNLHQLLKDFGVNNEGELSSLLVKESDAIPCIICLKEINIEDICFIGGEPYCKLHYRQTKYG